jgi:hypothetical protein
MMSESGGDSPNLLERITGTGGGSSSKSSSGSSSNAKLNKTLSNLNSAIAQLPGKMQTAIGSMELTVKPAGAD